MIQQSPEEEKVPKVFDLGEKKMSPGQSSIVPQPEFKKNFEIFTEGQLREMDWSNVFCAGGCVMGKLKTKPNQTKPNQTKPNQIKPNQTKPNQTEPNQTKPNQTKITAALQPIPAEHSKTTMHKRNYFHNIAYRSSDVDLFIYGLDETQALQKLKYIFNVVREAIPVEIVAFRSKHAITFVSQYPYRHIQIILRIYKSPAEILMGFDVDCCSVGYDGRRVWTTPRAHRALVTQCNHVDLSRRSPSYELRLAKYGARGFQVAVPTLQRNRVDPQLYERSDRQGLAKLLQYEKLATAVARQRYKDALRVKRLRPSSEEGDSFWSHLSSHFSGDEFLRERQEELLGGEVSDYSTVFLAWGPGITAKKNFKLMYSKDYILNSKWYDPKKTIHTHPCFFGHINDVVEDCCGCCPPGTESQPEDSPYVYGKLRWITDDPGRQTIGSFHPITTGDWQEGAYTSPMTDKIAAAVQAGDVAAVRQLIQDGVDLQARDGLGRTPLLLAAFCNSVACADELLKAGAWVAFRTPDGRTPLHVSCQYGNHEIARLICERGKRLEEEKAARKKVEDER